MNLGEKNESDREVTHDVMGSVPRIAQSEGELLITKEQIPRFVELPAQKACEHLYDLNIKTISSSANPEHEEAWLTIDWDSLSQENREIVKRQGLEIEEGRVRIQIPFTKETPIQELESKLLEMAQKFKPQEFRWAPHYTNDALKTYFRKLYKLSEEQWSDERIEQFIDGAVENEEWYYDEAQQLYFRSKEHAQKYKESLMYGTGNKTVSEL